MIFRFFIAVSFRQTIVLPQCFVLLPTGGGHILFAYSDWSPHKMMFVAFAWLTGFPHLGWWNVILSPWSSGGLMYIYASPQTLHSCIHLPLGLSRMYPQGNDNDGADTDNHANWMEKGFYGVVVTLAFWIEKRQTDIFKNHNMSPSPPFCHWWSAHHLEPDDTVCISSVSSSLGNDTTVSYFFIQIDLKNSIFVRRLCIQIR